ncbi:hypothetical protein MAA8898_05143 [Maliponia aquimaris]|uniref:Uncharacterized protein n=1 Tax=Maliponia aquimaris TaxID=1673631 RepID=A0A238L9E7_9RHOB|nr:hypothetical protein MAA8898_05143 [Maliponia aquimaris]
MAQPLQLTPPVMRSRARLDPDQAARAPFEECGKLAAPKLTPYYNLAVGVYAVDLNDILGEINSDCANFEHGWLLQLGQ